MRVRDSKMFGASSHDHAVIGSGRDDAAPVDGRGHPSTLVMALRRSAAHAALCLIAVSVVLAPRGSYAQPAALQTADAATAMPASGGEYRLGPGDKLKIVVFGEESLSGEFAVSDAGRISMPLIGEVAAGGHTVPDVQKTIAAQLADGGFLKQPRVSAEVLNFRPFHILGEVNKPGEYPYSSGLTVMNAVAKAAGFTYRANTKRVYIRRAGSDHEEKVPLTAAMLVQPGDTIRIAERFF